jgi:hypothetical protein
MSESTEFRPIEAAPARRVWPYALIGLAVVAALFFVIRRNSAPATPEKIAAQPQEALANLAPKIDAPQVAAALKPPEAAPAKPIAAEGPNVLGGAVKEAKALAATAKSGIDREISRSRSSQKQIDAYKKQNAQLQAELEQARAQITALQAAKRPPPPSDQEQILQMLAPVLRSSNDGRP